MITMVTPLNNQEAVAQYNHESSPQEITRVTLSSIHKVEGNKEPESVPVMHTDYRLAVGFENGNSSDVFDVPVPTTTIPTQNLETTTTSATNDTSQEVLNDLNGDDQDQNQYKCPKCNRSFSRKFNMQSHLATHDSERVKFSCEYPSCGLSFTRKHDLKRHVIGVHEDQKEFSCPYCYRTFARKDAFKRHTLSCGSNSNDDEDEDNGEGSSSNLSTNENRITRSISRGTSKRIISDALIDSTDIGENKIHTRSVSHGISKNAIADDSDDSKEVEEVIKSTRRGRPPKRQLDSPNNDESITNVTEKARRGRPRKIVQPKNSTNINDEKSVPKKRGRPRKDPQEKPVTTIKTGKRGRPRKIIEPEEQKPVNGRGRPRKIQKVDEVPTPATMIIRKRGRPKRELEDNKDNKSIETTYDTTTTVNRRGRPRKFLKTEDEHSQVQNEPRKRGRPRKNIQNNENKKVKSNKRGRPRKIQVNELDSQLSTFNNDSSTADGVEIDELIDELTSN